MQQAASQRLREQIADISHLQMNFDTSSGDRMVLELPDIDYNAATNFITLHDRHRAAVVTAEDILSLSEQVSDIDIGDMPHHEYPYQPTASTPAEIDKEYKPLRDKL